MTALLQTGIAPYFAFHSENIEQPSVFSLRSYLFELDLKIYRRHLTLHFKSETDSATQKFEVGIAPLSLDSMFRLTFETDPAGFGTLILERDDAIVFAIDCAVVLDESSRLATRNLHVRSVHRQEQSLSGTLSAPDQQRSLVLVATQQPSLSRAISGILEEQMPAGTQIRILLDDGAEPDPFGRSVHRADMSRESEAWQPTDISSVVLICFTGMESLDPEEIFSVVDWCPAHALRLFKGGFVQKMPIGRFYGVTDTLHPMLLSNGLTLPPLSVAPGAWHPNVPDTLTELFEHKAPSELSWVRLNDANSISPSQYQFSTPYWRINSFWVLHGIDAPTEDAFTFDWLLHALCGQASDDMGATIAQLRMVTKQCRQEDIRVLGFVLAGETPTYVLVDRDLLELATDASYSRGLHPLEHYFKAIDEAACRVCHHQADDMRIVLMHVDTLSDETLLNTVLHQIAEALRANDQVEAPTVRMRGYLDACYDVVSVAAAVNAISGGHAYTLSEQTIKRFALQHPRLMVPLVDHVLRNAAPSKIRTFMQTIDQLSMKLQPQERSALLKLLIDTRVFPESDEKYWDGLEDQPYDARRWGALQVLEQLPSDEYATRAPLILEKLELQAEDLAFNQVLGALKGGDLSAALREGFNAVLGGKLRPENERDILAIAILAEDFDAADAIEGALSQPLSPLDVAYREGCQHAREGTFTDAARIECTQKILAQDNEFADLRVPGRTYKTLAEFATKPEPGKDVICVITAKNEESRLRETLAYHHSLGLRHFILIDNMSSDGTLDLAREYGAKIIQTAESYKDSRYGMAWVNDVLDRYCTGFWTLVVDADEMFVYPDAENRPLSSFTKALDDHGYEAFGCILLDMYPEAPISSFEDVPKGELRALYQHFDARNFAFWPRLRSPLLGLSGGVRDRFFRTGQFADLAPIAQTKTPLVHWKPGMKYLTSTHDITPVRSPVCFGALEHYKYTPDFVQRAKREVIRKEHWGGGSEYAAYASVLEADPDMSFVDPRFTQTRESSSQLIRTVCPFPWDENLM